MNSLESKQNSALILKAAPQAPAGHILASGCRIEVHSDSENSFGIQAMEGVKLFSTEHLSRLDYCNAADETSHPERRRIEDTDYFVYHVYAAELRISNVTWVLLAAAYSGLLRELIRNIEGQFANKTPLRYLKIDLEKFLKRAGDPEVFHGELKIMHGEFRLEGDVDMNALNVSGKNFVASEAYERIQPAIAADGVSMIPTRFTCCCNVNARFPRSEEARPFDLKLSLDEHGNYKFKTVLDKASLRTMREFLNALSACGSLNVTETCPVRRRNGPAKKA